MIKKLVFRIGMERNDLEKKKKTLMRKRGWGGGAKQQRTHAGFLTRTGSRRSIGPEERGDEVVLREKFTPIRRQRVRLYVTSYLTSVSSGQIFF